MKSYFSRSTTLYGIIVLAFAILFHLTTSIYAFQPVDTSGISIDYSFQLEHFEFPEITGYSLQILKWIYQHTFIGDILSRWGMKDNKLHTVLDLASQLPPETPYILLPILRLTPSEERAHINMAQAFGKDWIQGNLSNDDVSLRRSGPRLKTVLDYADAYRSGKTDPVKEAKRYLGNVRKLEHLKMWAEVKPDNEALRVMEQARESKARFIAGKPLSIWDGVFITVKNELDVKGIATKFGTKYSAKMEPRPAKLDDIVVKHFREAGAIIAGITVMTEFGMSPIGWNPHFQAPFNPYNKSYHTGGSSAGSAVSVAAGLVPVAIGKDGGGSVRLPAAMSGVVGVIGSYGRVPTRDVSTSVTHVGVECASVSDAILSMALIGQIKPKHSLSSLYGGNGPPPFHFAPNGIRGLRIGYFMNWFEAAEPEVLRLTKPAVEYLVSKGASLVEFALPNINVLMRAHQIAILTEMGASNNKYWTDLEHNLTPSAVFIASLANQIPGSWTLAAQKLRGWAMQILDEAFQRFDVIITPTIMVGTPENLLKERAHGKVDIKRTTSVMWYVFLSNLLGIPAITIPIGYRIDNSMPTGLMVMARHWDEYKMLRVAQYLEVNYAGKIYKFPPEENFAEGGKASDTWS